MALEPSNKRAKERYDKILETSLELFLQKGYEATSLNDIIEKSGGSLSTIYKYFENKDGLFKAILENGVKAFKAEIDEKVHINSNLSIEEYLTKFADIYLDIIFNPKVIMLSRVVLTEGFKKDSHLRKIFFDYAILKIRKVLGEFFYKNIDSFKLNPSEFERAAFYFCVILREPYHYNAVFFNHEVNFTEKQKQEHIKNSVELFLNGFLKR